MRTHYYGPRDRKAYHWIDIYESHFTVVLCHSIPKAYKRMFGQEYEESDGSGETMALHSYHQNAFVIFIRRDNVTYNSIVHEIFHCTHRMMERVGVKMDFQHHEAHAILNGYLAGILFNDLRKWKTKIISRIK